MGNICAPVVYFRSTMGISHHKKCYLVYTMKLWKGMELEVF